MIFRTGPLRTPLLALALFAGCASPQTVIDTPAKRGELVGGLQTGNWTYSFPNGVKMAQGDFERDRQTGLWTYWYTNGEKEWQGIFQDHALHGPCSAWHSDGSAQSRGYFLLGEEDGPWSFSEPDGLLAQTGDFTEGRRTLRWTQYRSDGSTQSEGYFFNDHSMGVWKFWSADGSLSEEVFASHPGVELCLEYWPNGNIRREGFLRNGKHHGRWVSWHAEGTRRMQGNFKSGLPVGRWRAWELDGSPLAVGDVSAQRPTGTWTLWVDRVATQVGSENFDPILPFKEWSEDSVSAWFPPTQVIPSWISELSAPGTSTPESPTGAPQASAKAKMQAGRRPRIVIRQQPWTVVEEENLQAMIDLYSGKVSRRAGSGAYGGRSQRPAKNSTEKVAAGKHINHPLPLTRLLSGDADVLDLNDFKGKKNVLLVVLRGYAGYVCAYCVAQTKALRDHQEEFDALNTEIIVVYPGRREHLDAFLRSYESLVEEEGALPVTIAYDEEFELVDSLELRADMALPSTLLIDKDGIVRYAYIGADKVDRPNAEDLLEAVAELP